MQEGSRLSSFFGTIGTTPAKCLGYFHLSIKRVLDEIAQPSIFNSPPSMINKLPLSAGHGCQAPGARNLDLLALADSLRVFHQRAKKKRGQAHASSFSQSHALRFLLSWKLELLRTRLGLFEQLIRTSNIL